MSEDKKSRELFESLCDKLEILYERIPEQGRKTPDYNIFPYNEKVVCEVKKIIVEGKDDIKPSNIRKAQGGMVIQLQSFIPGERVRRKIRKANPQLKESAEQGYSTLLILHADAFTVRHIDGYNIKVAMYGLDTDVLCVPRNYSQPLSLLDRKSGGNRKMTPEQNTSIVLSEL